MKKIYLFFGALLVLEFILATICGPYSCEWGNGVYFYSGIVIALASLALPFFQKEWVMGKRIGISLVFAGAVIVIWVIGFMVFEFRIMCRLF